ncbi:MAG TPA: hypothetical protein VNF24_04710 [Candidatus Acidoferrales bacterium]|nr:hypothetical protein [Candidatus Acidoferrales bacterium]
MEMPEGLDSDGAARERVLREVGETMLMIEAAITRARRAMDTIRREADPHAQALASLAKATRDLEGVRRRLHQEAYLHVDVLPLQ